VLFSLYEPLVGSSNFELLLATLYIFGVNGRVRSGKNWPPKSYIYSADK